MDKVIKATQLCRGIHLLKALLLPWTFNVPLRGFMS